MKNMAVRYNYVNSKANMFGNIETVNKSDMWTFKFYITLRYNPFSFFCMLRILDDTLQILYDIKMWVTDSL